MYRLARGHILLLLYLKERLRQREFRSFIDVGARSEIYALMFRLAEEGKSILVASSDTPEILGLCDRVIVMREGRIAGELARAEATQEALLRLALPDSRAAARA